MSIKGIIAWAASITLLAVAGASALGVVVTVQKVNADNESNLINNKSANTVLVDVLTDLRNHNFDKKQKANELFKGSISDSVALTPLELNSYGLGNYNNNIGTWKVSLFVIAYTETSVTFRIEVGENNSVTSSDQVVISGFNQTT
ncbi:hypothetical protein [Mycoplasmopsis agassizii]|uniref:Uncharacterized protein n=1 Tax=Mycoplasmopsis agassizii TaxID=33922 RepID=A0ABX4H5U8_9BACT|nr:hypothetical protein [Mycoplasmopsis agassizii]PAF55260.1 hypothetical protein CJF60_01055 [Mycoplasmopsis agassizii]SMC15678.1 hypothetical protein SAMN02745179_00028 [Mycoplasmopsis agassizii]